MKKFLLAFFIFSSLFAKSQAYNNEWIDYNKTYYKFTILSYSPDMHRITQPVLASIGLQNIPAEQFQLWKQGQQIPLYTSVQTGVLGTSDYIEFQGDYNSGKSDRDLYRNPDFQLNDVLSFFTDSICYYLTVNPVGDNFRLAPVANNVASNVLPAEKFFMRSLPNFAYNKINPGLFASVGSTIYSSAYDQGEGYTSNDIGTGQTLNDPGRTNLGAYTGADAPSAIYKFNAAGNAQNPRQLEIKLNGNVIASQPMDFFDYVKLNIPIPVSAISAGAYFEYKNAGTEPNDQMVFAYSELLYPKQFNFDNSKNFYFELPANTNGNYLEITNFNHGGVPPVLYDYTNGKRYVADITNPAIIKIALLPSSTDRKLGLVSSAADNIHLLTTTFKQRNFLNITQSSNQGNYIIISNSLLANGANGSNPLEEYKLYRNSSLGGGFNAKIYMIDEITDQFGFGIRRTPLAVRNFIRWARDKFTTTPVKDIFIIGKGVTYEQVRVENEDPRVELLDLVPTWGRPGSDILLSAERGNDIPLTPIGRLSVVRGDEITTYLNKVKEYEHVQTISSPVIADKAWMKNVVHLVGASDQNLQTILDFDMNKYKNTVKDTFYGANVQTFSKTSTDPVEQSNNIRLQNLFHEGLGIVTYFGHSSATTLEYNLDDPQTYNNQGKYPLFIFLGCNAGNFFNFNLARLATDETISEKYVLAKDRGGIASFASTSLGIVHYLDIYNTDTYEALSHTKYGKSLGEIMQEGVTQTFNITTQNDFYSRLQCEQTTLHGDPAIKLNNFAKPDYVIEDPLVKISPSFISVAQDSFKVSASFLNIGRAINKKIVVELKRTYPDFRTEIIRDTIPGTRFADTLYYSIPIVGTRDKGANKITITIDADNTVDELYESNNSITKDLFIYEDEARLVSPNNFAIVNQQDIKLIASTANPFSTSRQYNMELDTTELFNSPFKISKSINTTGGTFEFDPGITFQDSAVYYWRVAPVPVSGSPLWNTASFVYLGNSGPGFNQSHYYQHVKSEKDNVLLDPQNRNWVFDSTGHFIFAKNGVFLTATQQEGDIIVSPDGSPYIRSACLGYSIVFNVFDQRTFVPELNLNGHYGSASVCDPTRQWNYEFSYMNSSSRKLAMDFMDSIPNGAFVVVRNILNNFQGSGFINEWKTDDLSGANKTLYHKLKSVGFNAIDSFTSPRAFIYIYQKGNNGFIPVSVVSNGIYDLVSVTKDLKTPDSLGYITSPVFGKAKAWKQLKWRGTSSPDVTPGDAPTVDVIGIDNQGVESTLLTGITASQQDYDISTINAAQYPSIRLKMANLDPVNFTAYQLRYWRVTYDPVPEGAVAPNLFLKVKDTVDVGEPMEFKVAFKNITSVAFDSMRAKIIITDKDNLAHIVPLKFRKLLASPDTLQVGAIINTSNLAGANTLYFDVNPDNDQPEQYHFNNFGFRNLYVRPDSLNPLLDVTFDGSHILNRDIVSSKPDIIVKLKDEARWMILNDTSLLTLNIHYPDGTSRRIYFNNDTLKFTPAGQAPNPDNTATINFKPFFKLDGEYEMIISAKDRSENAAGNIEYRVIFEVINKPMISNMLNYPNPFTTSTAFVFTITGSEVPQNIKIEIMTITGKIVREITKDELGPLQIGRNITEFKWDGTDQFGSKLANGIYLYRVVTNLNGKALDKYKAKNDNTDKYFNKGYGKMYLMR